MMREHVKFWRQGVALATLVISAVSASADESGALKPIELFEQRIMPIFRSPKPSSCVQCHLAAVDLKNYILPSHEKTFVSLRDQGLIDLQVPSNSKILKLIRMGDRDADKGAQLIHAKTRRAEYEAFAAWIAACCDDPQLNSLPKLTAAELARPARVDAVIRHARKSRIVDSFVRHVWSQRMRCFPCHTPSEISPDMPRYELTKKKRDEMVAKFGEERLNIFRDTPEATLDHWIESSRQAPSGPSGRLPLLNLKSPDKSLIILKPTSKVPARDPRTKQFVAPSSVEPVSHMGGLKMHKDDQSYKSFLAWIEDYAKVVDNRYTAVEELPADNWYASKLVLKLMGAPKAWSPGTPVQLFLHPRDGRVGWRAEPIAFTQGTVTPRRIVNGALFVFASEAGERPDPENARLPSGEYLVKVYRDSQQILNDDPTRLLNQPAHFGGQIVLDASEWKEGFKFGLKLFGKDLQSPADDSQ